MRLKLMRLFLTVFIIFFLVTIFLELKFNTLSFYKNDYKKIKVKEVSSYVKLCDLMNIDPNQNLTQERYFVNITRSSEIGVIRTVPDTRPTGCSNVLYNTEMLPDASVIIPMHEEPWSTLLRTVHSILTNTPRVLLKEILLIDDNSEHQSLHEPLEKYINQFPNVVIVRSKERIGVIRGRQKGLELAKGEVVVYVDSHSEVNVGWIEPLLYEIAKYNHTVAAPVLDTIDPMTLKYQSVMNFVRGGMMWNLAFKYTDVPTNTKVALLPMDPYYTPTIPAGAFAINRRYLQDLGGFPTSMKIWGGEDVELSIRAWLCGGRLLYCPCSRVGHIFKSSHVYKLNVGDIHGNIIQIAETWLGTYKTYFYAVTGGSLQQLNITAIKEFDLVKKKFKCKSFDWYIENVFPELGIPPLDALYFGPLGYDGVCLGLQKNNYNVLSVLNCFNYKSKNFALMKSGELRVESYCVVPDNDTLKLHACNETSYGKWTYVDKILQFNNNVCINIENKRNLKIITCQKLKSLTPLEFRYKLTFS